MFLGVVADGLKLPNDVVQQIKKIIGQDIAQSKSEPEAHVKNAQQLIKNKNSDESTEKGKKSNYKN